MHIVICEDEPYYQDVICTAIDKWIKASGNLDVACTCFSSSEEFLTRWENGLSADLLFLDIQIPCELNGMSLAKRIRQRDQTVAIVFVTNFADYVYEGYSVNALRYLKKPVHDEDIFSCMDIAYRRLSLLQQEKLSVICRDQRLALPFSEILYVEMQSHYVRLTIAHSEEKPEVRARLRDFATQLPQQLFVQCHRSYIVNLEHIRRFTRESLTMSNQDSVPISQTFAAELRKQYDWYYIGK
ncbi:MAG: LytTR family DNA-binding domain-containing protein [Eubacteriales bacterium]|nr:LytTR family DNA-binding domain-containing protein [Eubacteriales bacterium]